MSVSSVPAGGLAPQSECLSSVPSVLAIVVGAIATGSINTTGAVTGNGPIVGTQPPDVCNNGNPYMAPDQGDECHACGWDDAEIETFADRAASFALIGRVDAEHLAERLTLRDRQADDRRMCVECRELDSTGHCAAARRGAMYGVDRRLEPVWNVLLRCVVFKGKATCSRLNKGP